jgi:hypothetical protein
MSVGEGMALSLVTCVMRGLVSILVWRSASRDVGIGGYGGK